MAANNVYQVKYRFVAGAYGGKPLSNLGENNITYVIANTATDYATLKTILSNHSIAAPAGTVLDITHVAPAMTPVVYGTPTGADWFWRVTWHEELGGKQTTKPEQSADFISGIQNQNWDYQPNPVTLLSAITANFPPAAGATIVVERANLSATSYGFS